MPNPCGTLASLLGSRPLFRFLALLYGALDQPTALLTVPLFTAAVSIFIIVGVSGDLLNPLDGCLDALLQFTC
ncbi:hypothetical protein E2320_013444 [Naja naja]|nr:hypothetical protein E2320_013444 [Naja naja]